MPPRNADFPQRDWTISGKAHSPIGCAQDYLRDGDSSLAIVAFGTGDVRLRNRSYPLAEHGVGKMAFNALVAVSASHPER